MSELQDLLHACCTCPWRDVSDTVEILADWLEEHGDARADLVRRLESAPRRASLAPVVWDIRRRPEMRGLLDSLEQRADLPLAVDLSDTVRELRERLLDFFPELGRPVWGNDGFRGWEPAAAGGRE